MKQIDEHAYQKTKIQIKSLRKQADAKLSELRCNVYGNRNYVFVSKVKDNKFGEIVIDNFDANTGMQSLSLGESSGGGSRRGSMTVQSLSLEEEDINRKIRPSNKFIRLEIKPLVKKRYSIY